MSGYWNTVPRGIWSLLDPVDALNALRDQETSWVLDTEHNRVNLFGTQHKALILDLDKFNDFQDAKEFRQVMDILNLERACR